MDIEQIAERMRKAEQTEQENEQRALDELDSLGMLDMELTPENRRKWIEDCCTVLTKHDLRVPRVKFPHHPRFCKKKRK